ncbi:MAG: tRNA (adenosine(37)-N6)-threonylcarbamoyltransferase complex transferase subunit TsaD, partial [Candidatus Muirbacterium halophilum]|nr:tRNA (adenosine(37)-N6)-threonylcarbamoyltransferase complex transferase subunit TsaD [Candidatus Muirbacterium halophilum]
MKYLFAIETSCDDTSVSILNMNNGEVIDTLSISQMIHEKFGGVVPELASRKHFTNIYPLIHTILKNNKLKYNDIDIIATTYAPGLLGSLLIGVTVAKTKAYSLNIPLIPVHHIEGHIVSNFIEKQSIDFPFIALVISGGHTQLVKVDDFHNYIILGDTLDDSSGEAFDKVAKMLELAYPGGPVVDKLAKNGNKDFNFPRPLLNKPNNDFSFSGLKTAVKVFIKNNPTALKEDICFSFQNAVCEVLKKKTNKVLKQYNIKKLVLAGGVAANSQIREEFSKIQGIEVLIPQKKYCTDNAGMIAKAAWFRYKNNFNILMP